MKTRLRKLYVGGRSCTWSARVCHLQGEADCHRGIRLRVWGAGKNSRVLQVDLLSKTWPAPWGVCATDGAYPTSKDVRAVIDYALRHGWEPDAIGGRFLLTEGEHGEAFELDAFLLTDRLLNPDAPDPSARVLALHQGQATRVD
jgi:hypothetical protein